MASYERIKGSETCYLTMEQAALLRRLAALPHDAIERGLEMATATKKQKSEPTSGPAGKPAKKRETFSETLRLFLIEQRKLTGEGVMVMAKRLGINGTQFSQWLHGTRNMGVSGLDKVCEAYGLFPAANNIDLKSNHVMEVAGIVFEVIGKGGHRVVELEDELRSLKARYDVICAARKEVVDYFVTEAELYAKTAEELAKTAEKLKGLISE